MNKRWNQEAIVGGEVYVAILRTMYYVMQHKGYNPAHLQCEYNKQLRLTN
jgi:hypothetical protein